MVEVFCDINELTINTVFIKNGNGTGNHVYLVKLFFPNVEFLFCGTSACPKVLKLNVESLFKLCRLHLAVSYAYTCVGNSMLDNSCKLLHARYPVGDEEYLAVAAQLESHSLLDYLGIEVVYLGVYGVAVGRRCLYHG